jgi:hypothetical protein
MQLNQTDTTRQLGMLLARIFKGFWQWVLLVNALIWMQLAAAQTASVQVGIQDRYELSRSFTFLEDPSATLTLGDILQPAAQAGFRAVPQGATSTNFGSTNSAIWLRVVLQTVPSSPRHWMFEVAYPPLDRMDLYISSPGGQFIQQSGGDSLPFASRLVPHRSHIKPIELEPGSSTTVYLRIASQGSVSAPVTLWQSSALWQQDQKTYSVFSLYFGLLFGLLLYNLLLFMSIRDPAYLIYVVFVAFIGLSQAANSGLGGNFFGPTRCGGTATPLMQLTPPVAYLVYGLCAVFWAAKPACPGWIACYGRCQSCGLPLLLPRYYYPSNRPPR